MNTNSQDEAESVELSKLKNDKKVLEDEVMKLRQIIAKSRFGLRSFETEPEQSSM